jgi:cytochrome c553
MRELGICVAGLGVFFLFFVGIIYPDIEYKNIPSNSTCYGECYEEYVRVNGTFLEQLEEKKLAASADEFSSIKGLWAGCAACHGNEGQGVAVFPKLAGQTADYVTGRLNAYRNRETIGNMSTTMWGQAGDLTDQQIQTLSKYIEQL